MCSNLGFEISSTPDFLEGADLGKISGILQSSKSPNFFLDWIILFHYKQI
jgi:hypothetical protein